MRNPLGMPCGCGSDRSERERGLDDWMSECRSEYNERKALAVAKGFVRYFRPSCLTVLLKTIFSRTISALWFGKSNTFIDKGRIGVSTWQSWLTTYDEERRWLVNVVVEFTETYEVNRIEKPTEAVEQLNPINGCMWFFVSNFRWFSAVYKPRHF